MEKSRQELETAIHNKNILEQRKKRVERREPKIYATVKWDGAFTPSHLN